MCLLSWLVRNNKCFEGLSGLSNVNYIELWLLQIKLIAHDPLKHHQTRWACLPVSKSYFAVVALKDLLYPSPILAWFLDSRLNASKHTMANSYQSPSQANMLISLTVGKVDAGVAVLLTEDKRLVSPQWDTKSNLAPETLTDCRLDIPDRIPLHTSPTLHNLRLHSRYHRLP